MTVESTVGGRGGGLPGVGMKLEAVHRAVGPADGRVVAKADAGVDAHRDGRLRPPCNRVGGRLPEKNSRPLGGSLCRWPSGRPVDGEADGWAHFHRSERLVDGEADGWAHFHRSERPSATPRF